MSQSRTQRVLKNARISAGFYLLAIFLAFFSRKIFLECLGADYVGLTGTLSNILGYLNLAELGIGSALVFNLYKPVFDGDEGRIRSMVSFYGWFNRRIGLFIVGAGVLFSLFLPLMFGDAQVSLPLVFFAFYVILGSSVLGYFVNYRQILLFADQRHYLVDSINQGVGIVKTLTQIYVTLKTGSYYAWIIIEGVYGVVQCIVLNNRINRVYPWLRCSVRQGAADRHEYRSIMLTTRKVFVHKIKDFFLTQNDQFIVFIFLSLKMVAYYGNYVMIVTRLFGFITHLFSGTEAGVGHLLAQNHKPRIIEVFWELTAVRYFIAGVICFVLYHLMTPFITVWLGEEYVLANGVMILLVVNLFIMISRGTVDDFNSAYGNYGDTWAAWVELGLNVSVTLIGGYFWGLYGILLGKTAGLLTIIVFWKPYYLFSRGFGMAYNEYWRHAGRNLAAVILSWVVGGFVVGCIGIDPCESIGWWIVAAMVYTLLISVVLLGSITLMCKGGNELFHRFARFYRRMGAGE